MTDEQFKQEVLVRLDMIINGFRDALGYLHCIDAKLHGVVVPTPEHKDQAPAMAVRTTPGKEDKSRKLVPHDYVPPGEGKKS